MKTSLTDRVIQAIELTTSLVPRDVFDRRIAELESERDALKALVREAAEWVEYSNLDDHGHFHSETSVGHRCCCGVIAYRDHKTWCKFAAAIDAARGE